MTLESIFSSVNALEIKLSVNSMQWSMGHLRRVFKLMLRGRSSHWLVRNEAVFVLGIILKTFLSAADNSVLQKTGSMPVKPGVEMNGVIVYRQPMNTWRNMTNSIWLLPIMAILIKLYVTFHTNIMAKLIQNVLPMGIIIEKNGVQQHQIMILTKSLVFAKRHAFKMGKNTKKAWFKLIPLILQARIWLVESTI